MQTRPRVVADDDDKDYVLEDQVGHLLRRAHQRHTSIFQEHIGDSQLTPLQFAALVKLSPSGTRLLTGCIANGVTVTERTLKPLSLSERASLLDLLRRIS